MSQTVPENRCPGTGKDGTSSFPFPLCRLQLRKRRWSLQGSSLEWRPLLDYQLRMLILNWVISSNESEFCPESFNYLNFLVLWSCILDGSWLGIYPFASGPTCAFVLWVKSVCSLLFRSHFLKAPMLFLFWLGEEKEQSHRHLGEFTLVRPYRFMNMEESENCFSFSSSTITHLCLQKAREAIV